MRNWYLLHTKIRQEKIALENLERQGFECFLPVILAEKLRGSILKVVEEPLFTRYMFIRLDDNINSQSWSPIRSTIGVSRLVSFGHKPARIEDALIDELRARGNGQEVQKRRFEQGDPVVITKGPFSGVEAIFEIKDAQERVIVLLNILSKQVRMSLSPAEIKKLY